jgi:hypothetical protein
MAFDSRAIDRSLPSSSLVVGSVFKDDPEKLHSDLIDLDIGVGLSVGVGIRTGGRDVDEDDEDGFFKSLTESIASGNYSITTERKISGKEVKVLTH